MLAANDAQSHIFVSYSRRNTDKMLLVAQALRQANIAVWTDERLTAGTPSWKKAIEQAIQSASGVVVLMSPSAKASEWVERELDYAYVHQCPIYPVLVEGSQRDSVPFELINMQYIDGRSDFEQQLAQLISLLTPGVTASLELRPAGAEPDLLLSDQAAALAAGSPPAPADTYSEASVLTYLLHTAGVNQDNIEGAGQHTARLGRVARWYWFEPRKFRLFNSLSQDSTARCLHVGATTLACLWLLGWAAFLWWRPEAIRWDFLLFVTVIFAYGLAVMVPLAVPYKTRRAFFSSILFGVLLSTLMGVLLLIAYNLANALGIILGSI